MMVRGRLARISSARRMSLRDRQKIAALVLFVPANENEEAAAGGNDIAMPQRWIVYDSVRGFRFQGIRRRGRCLRARVGDEILRAATGGLDALLPLLARHGAIGKLGGVLGEAAPRTGGQEPSHNQYRDPISHGSMSSDPAEGHILAAPTKHQSLRRFGLPQICEKASSKPA